MKRWPPETLPWIPLAAFIAVIVTEAMWLRAEWRAALRAQAALAWQLQERDRLAAQAPALTEENEEAISADRERARRELAEAKAVLRGGEAGPGAEPAPTGALEAYFSIANFVERNRAAANAAHMALRAEERFGFAAFAHEGPAVDIRPQVHRQLQAAETLLEHLIAAQPRALLAMRRETAGTNPPVAGSQSEDCFVMDRALSAGRPGVVETVAFRVEFSGQTATLRQFLAALAARPQPFLVRSVEVDPLPAAASAASATGLPATTVPLVRHNFSRFTVIVESVELAPSFAQEVP